MYASLNPPYRSDSSVDIVKLLLAKGANLNERDEDGATPLIRASHHRQLFGADVMTTLIKAGADVNASERDGTTALMRAATGLKGPSSEAVKVLLDNRANVNAQDAKGNTALILSLKQCQDFDAINELISHGADVTIKNKYGESAFGFASDEKIIKLMQTRK